MDDRPIVAITMGDPSGIGPEIIVKALKESGIHDMARPVVLGDPNALMAAGGVLSSPPLREISDVSEAGTRMKHIDILPLSRLEEASIQPGRPSIEGGRAMVAYILKAVELAVSGNVSAVVTCPISKSLMQKAGYAYEGHTRLLADLTHCREYVMMLAGKRLRVALVTIHCPLRDVPRLIGEDNIFKTMMITGKALREDFGIEDPRLAVAALNPHAGEEGLFGSEEKEVISPAVERAAKEGLHVSGPLPPDTVFYRAAAGQFDAVIAMYHDQGLIPLKLLHFSDAVNVTLGLPIVRTSVDHGTAYDIAGKDMADPSSLIEAIRMAARMAVNRAKKRPLDGITG